MDEASRRFEASLVHYMAQLELPPRAAAYVKALIEKHDFSSARAHLVPSVPGEHGGELIHCFHREYLPALTRMSMLTRSLAITGNAASAPWTWAAHTAALQFREVPAPE